MDSAPGLGEDFMYIISFNLDHKSLKQVSISILTKWETGALMGYIAYSGSHSS